MIHKNRRFCVRPMFSVEDLAEELTRVTSWTLCTGFEYMDFYWLNDSLSEDGAQEYAVVCEGRQVESVTVSWCTRDKLEQIIREILRGKFVDSGAVNVRTESPTDHGTCHLCR